MSNVIIKMNILVIEGILDSVLSLPFLNIYVGIFIYRMQVATKRLSFPASIAGARMMYDIYIGAIQLAIYTANEEPVRIQYKCLVPIYGFPEMKLLFPKQNHNVLSTSSYTLLYL
jgi:hypothetical protein